MALKLSGSFVREVVLCAVALVMGPLLLEGRAVAEEASRKGTEADRDIAREAATHFQQGVTLYGEADYRGARVEFDRAYALFPSRVVLYNLGQTDYQLRDYAGALNVFERYLADASPGDAHRAELERTVKELKSRVGRLMVMTTPPDAEVSIDDRSVGRTPFDKPMTVSMGRLKVSASAPGHLPVTRYVDVAAGDNESISLDLAASAVAASTRDSQPPATLAVAEPPSAADFQKSRSRSASWRTGGWVSTGVLAAGAIVFGIVAHRQSNDLQAERDVFPPSPRALDHKANLTTTFAVLTDSFAAAALLLGGLTLYSTLDTNVEAGPGAGAATSHGAGVTVGLGSVDWRVTF